MGKVTYNQKGYSGSSMSEGAVMAYNNGEMPRSKWTKKAMLSGVAAVLECNDLSGDLLSEFIKLKKQELFDTVMIWSSWHHTGKFANETDFFEVDDGNVLYFLESLGYEVA